MGRALHLNCASGISGDMLAGALLHLGADLERMRSAVASLGLGDIRLSREDVRRGGLAAVSFGVAIPPDSRRLPTPADVRETLERCGLPAPVARRCLTVFGRLAEAEAAAHGVPAEEIHFHELGSPDTVVDVLCAVVGLDSLGVSGVTVSPVNVGAGTVNTEHGAFPVPAPATAELLRGFAVFSDGEAGEKTTPTGAALLATLGRPGNLPSMTVAGVGYGAGNATFKASVNVLQALLLEAGPAGEDLSVILEANIDDLNPQVYPYLVGRLLAEGAQDAYLTPVIMKKGRPGILVTVVAPPELAGRLGEVLMAESSTIGLRRWTVDRTRASREAATLETPWGRVAVKVVTVAGRRRAAPEFEDCRRVAEASGRPLPEVMAELGRRAAEAFGDDDRS